MVAIVRCAAVVQPRACGPESGVPGERQFTSRGEDPQPVVRIRAWSSRAFR
jgi:hypothetical protein